MIEELSRHGYRLSPGTLYPLLAAMERRGLLRSSRERVKTADSRRMYRATPAGRAALRIAKKRVQELFWGTLRGRTMKRHGALLVFMLLACAKPIFAGPPFQTDDPDPVDFHHYEFYVFGNADGTGVEMDTAGPAAELGLGVLSNTQFHVVVPVAAMALQRGKLFARWWGRREVGLGDIEIGVKYRYLKETKHRPMIGTFTMLEVPSGNYNLGLGVGKVWAKLPVWVQKSFGPWTTYGGVGEQIVPQTGYNNFTYGGWLLQRDIGKKWTLGGEVFSHGAEGSRRQESER